VTQGGSVSEAVGSGLIDGISLPVSGVIVVLLIGAGLMAIGIFTGYPIATAFTVTGAVIGVGFALGGDPAWGSTPKSARSGYSRRSSAGNRLRYCERSSATGRSRGRQRSTPRRNRRHGRREPRVRVSLIGRGTLAAAGATLVSVDGTIATIAISLGLGAVAAALVRWDIGRDQAGGLRRFLLSLGALVAFSAGASQVGLAVGPLFPLLEDLPSVSPIAVLLGGGVGILVGSWTSAPRMIKSISQEYASLGPRRSISTLVPSFLIAQTAVLLGCRSRSTRSS